MPEYRKVQLPAYAGSYIGECLGNDGTVSVEISEKGRIIKIFDADWSTEVGGNWELASYSPLGQTLFQVEFVHSTNSILTKGHQADTMKKVGVSKNGIIEIDGHKVGLRADEVGCVLNHKIPQSWMSRVVEEKITNEGITYDIRDHDRKIMLTFGRHGAKGEYSWKADIKWSLFLGVRDVNLSMSMLRGEQALLLQSDQFKDFDCRVVVQEE